MRSPWLPGLAVIRTSGSDASRGSGRDINIGVAAGAGYLVEYQKREIVKPGPAGGRVNSQPFEGSAMMQAVFLLLPPVRRIFTSHGYCHRRSFNTLCRNDACCSTRGLVGAMNNTVPGQPGQQDYQGYNSLLDRWAGHQGGLAKRCRGQVDLKQPLLDAVLLKQPVLEVGGHTLPLSMSTHIFFAKGRDSWTLVYLPGSFTQYARRLKEGLKRPQD